MEEQYNMRVASIVSLGITPAGIWAQDVFEPPDFNVTEALLNNGVNVSAIPDLAGLVERSLSSGCSIAVSLAFAYGRYGILYSAALSIDRLYLTPQR